MKRKRVTRQSGKDTTEDKEAEKAEETTKKARSSKKTNCGNAKLVRRSSRLAATVQDEDEEEEKEEENKTTEEKKPERQLTGAMADPLTLLRDYTMSGKQVTLNGEDLHFEEDDLHFPCSTPTAFRSMAGLGEPYTLGACWHAMRAHTVQKSFVIYFKEWHLNPCFQRVHLLDWRTLINFLTGVISSSRNMCPT